MTNLYLGKIIVILACFVFLAPSVYAQTETNLLAQMRADYAALLEARAEFEQAEKSRNTSSQEQADYADWIKQLSRQFSDGCRSLSSVSAAPIPADLPCDEFTSSYLTPLQIDIARETTNAEKTAAMLGQFEASLGDFDEKLLREQDRVRANRPQTDSAEAGGGAAGGDSGTAGESGADSEGDSEGNSEGNEQRGDTGEAGEGAEQGESQAGEQGSDSHSGAGANQPADGSQGSIGSGNQSTVPDDIPDGSDDDIIARQLREAAEKETDPELKKKLWEEYRRYKEG